MRQGSKNQFYRYSMRSTIARGFLCTRKILIRQIPPDNAQSIENLFMHLRLDFSAGSLSSGDKVLYRVGILSSVPSYNNPEGVTRARFLTVNKAATADILDTKIDLSSLLDKTAINSTYVYLEIKGSTDVGSDGNSANIDLWKLDGIYTTREIR